MKGNTFQTRIATFSKHFKEEHILSHSPLSLIKTTLCWLSETETIISHLSNLSLSLSLLVLFHSLSPQFFGKSFLGDAFQSRDWDKERTEKELQFSFWLHFLTFVSLSSGTKIVFFITLCHKISKRKSKKGRKLRIGRQYDDVYAFVFRAYETWRVNEQKRKEERGEKILEKLYSAQTSELEVFLSFSSLSLFSLSLSLCFSLGK